MLSQDMLNQGSNNHNTVSQASSNHHNTEVIGFEIN